MKDIQELRRILKEYGYKLPPKDEDLPEFLKRKVSGLYKDCSRFKKFLDKHTDFVPEEIAPYQRWLYYLNDETEPHLCPVCGSFVKNYHTHCSISCGSKANNGGKRGPKVDLDKKKHKLLADLREHRPDYKVCKFDFDRTLFKHSCGSKLKAHPYLILAGRAKCSCLHKKIVKQTLENLQKRYADRNSIWEPIEYDSGPDALFLNKECGHEVKMPYKRNFDMRCTVCFKKMATNSKTDEQYQRELRQLKPEFKFIGTWVDSHTLTKYRHLECGQVFHAYPSYVRRPQFQCPACSPKSCGAYREFKIGDRVIRVRGKEKLALQFLIDKTDLDIDDIQLDVDGTVPKISYMEVAGSQRRIYKPDMYVPHLNMIIEVKDTRTIGLNHVFFYSTAEEMWKTNCAKAKACVAKGYKFRMILFNTENEVIKLPKLWWDCSHKEIRRYLSDKGRIPEVQTS